MRRFDIIAFALLMAAAGCTSSGSTETTLDSAVTVRTISDDPCDVFKERQRVVMGKAADLTTDALEADSLAEEIGAAATAELYEQVVQGFADLGPELNALGPPPAELEEPNRLLLEAFEKLEKAYAQVESGLREDDADLTEQGRAAINEGNITFNRASQMLPGACS